MKKNFFVIILGILLIFIINFNHRLSAMPNPWINCDDDISCASHKAGFNFPLRVKNYTVRAMSDMIEIKFPLDKKRVVSLRKSQVYSGNTDDNGIGDTSGVYVNYPVNKTISLNNGVMFNVRGKKNTFYVSNFAAENGYYSMYCEQGLNVKDINKLYEIIAEAEAPRNNFDEKESYSIEKLRELRTVDGIVEPVYTQDCFPRTLQKMGVSKDCFERANLGADGVCSASEVKMIKEYYKKGYKKDPLNNGEGQYCAK